MFKGNLKKKKKTKREREKRKQGICDDTVKGHFCHYTHVGAESIILGMLEFVLFGSKRTRSFMFYYFEFKYIYDTEFLCIS